MIKNFFSSNMCRQVSKKFLLQNWSKNTLLAVTLSSLTVKNIYLATKTVLGPLLYKRNKRCETIKSVRGCGMADWQNALKKVSSCNGDLCILPLAAQNFVSNTYLAHFWVKCQRELITEAFFVGLENNFRIT